MHGRTALLASLVAAGLAAGPGAARAGSLTCPLAEAGTIDVDGMLDDWQGVAPSRAGGRNADQSFDVRCLVLVGGDGRADGAARLALAIDVRDDKLIRFAQTTAKKQAAEDRLEISLRAGGEPLLLRLFPGTERIAPRRLLGAKGKQPRWLAVEDTQQPRGWSVELELPLARVPGWSTAAASLEAVVTFHDADDYEARGADPLAHRLTLALGDRPQLLERFLRDVRLRAKDLMLDAVADVDRTRRGPERVVAGGRILGLLGEQYAYVQLPVAAARDVLEVKLVDLRGDGSALVLTRLRQHGGGGSRDLLVLWGARAGQLEQVLAVEVRKEAEGNRLESTWRLAARPAKKARGQELVVEARPAVGWDEDSFEEDPADDAEPIHLPWDGRRAGGAYWLDGDTVRSRPLPRRKR
jgi:acetolactate synthase regulatory subunit